MTGERQTALIERLLVEAEAALVDRQWATVLARCESVRALEPDNTDAVALADAARRGLAASPSDASGAIAVPLAQSLLSDLDEMAGREDWSAVRRTARRLLDEDADNVEALLFLAQAAIAAEEWLYLGEVAAKVLALAPGNADALEYQRLANEEREAERTSPPARRPVQAHERLQRLSEYIARATLEGYIVIDRNDREATAVLSLPGRPVNHVLHFLVSTFTCGIWLIVWAILAGTQQREKRVRVRVDEFGTLLQEQMTLR